MDHQPWRLHLSNRSISRIDILPGEPPLLGVWARADRVTCYDLSSGAQMSDQVVGVPPTYDRTLLEWQNYVESLRAPNSAPLPVVRTPQVAIYTTHTGKRRVYHQADGTFHANGGISEPEQTLKMPPEADTVAMAHGTGAIYALSPDGALLGADGGRYSVGLVGGAGYTPGLAVSDDGTTIYATDGRRLVSATPEGKPRLRLELPAPISLMTCSPDGRYVLTSDTDTGVLRVYDGERLRQSHQRFAIDLIAGARQLQLMADLPPVTASVSAIAISNEGYLALTMYGVICLTSLEQMTRLPQARPVVS